MQFDNSNPMVFNYENDIFHIQNIITLIKKHTLSPKYNPHDITTNKLFTQYINLFKLYQIVHVSDERKAMEILRMISLLTLKLSTILL